MSSRSSSEYKNKSNVVGKTVSPWEEKTNKSQKLNLMGVKSGVDVFIPDKLQSLWKKKFEYMS